MRLTYGFTSFGTTLSKVVSLLKKSALLASVLCFFSSLAQAGGMIDDTQTVKSNLLAKEVNYTVYLPADYQTSKRSYPIFYLLHGGGNGLPTDWFMQGKIGNLLDKMIEKGEIPPMIVVTPDGRRDVENKFNTYYMNDADGKYRWEDMFIQEFMPAIEQKYRVAQEKRFRAIGGLSMGGYASLIYSFKYPDLFGSAAGLSAAFRTDEQVIEMDQPGYDRRYGRAWGPGLQGKDRINDKYLSYSVLQQVKEKPVKDIMKTRYYMDCGTDDDFFIGNALLHIEMNKLGVKHRFMARVGRHDWRYWTSGSKEMLLFVGKGFQELP